MKKGILHLLLLFVSITAIAQKTYVYFQNNTSLPFQVSSVQTGNHTMESSEWWALNGSLQPWQPNTNLLWTNRDAGIHYGSTFYLTTYLTSGGQTVELKLKLYGNLVGSTIWAAAAGPGFSDAWTSDRNFHQQSFSMNGKAFVIKYAFYFTGGYDDILYTIEEQNPFPVNTVDQTNAHTLNVLSYNVYMRPSELFWDDQAVRSKYIDDHVRGYDAILFQEVFDDDQRAVLLNQLGAEYPYQTSVVDIANHSDLDPVQDGGVLIVSKWPVEMQDQWLWNNTCNEDDCLAYKGIKYARINKLGRKYHLFATHMDAFNEEIDVNIRKAQMAQFKNYVQSKGIPATEGVLMGGDLNVDMYTNKWGEYDSLFTDHFGALEPAFVNPSQPTWDPNSNHYLLGASDAPEYLDYVLASKYYLPPSTGSNKVILPRGMEDEMWKIFDLSDHYAVHGRFEYPVMPVSCDTTGTSSVSNITTTGATVNWSTVSGASGYTLRYKAVSTGSWNSINVTGTTLALSALNPATKYEYQVQTQCVGGNGVFTSSRTFTTLSLPSCTDTYEANNTKNAAKTIALNSTINAQIGTATDQDWFKVSTTTAQKNLRITLSNLPANYDLALYNSKGVLLLQSVNTGTTNETISYNASKSASYFIRVIGVAGAFNNAACYALKVNGSATARYSDNMITEDSEDVEPALFLFPNPVASGLNVDLRSPKNAGFALDILDIQGRVTARQTVVAQAGENRYHFDVEALTPGLYLLTVTDEEGIVTRQKFIKQ